MVEGIGFLIAPAKSKAFNAEIAEDGEAFSDFFFPADGEGASGCETAAGIATFTFSFSAILACSALFVFF
jgi:hypothetical protein